MTPYYDDGHGIVLYHGDCRQMLPLAADCIVTDPPYKSLDIDVVRGTTTRLVGPRNTRGGDRIDSGDWFVTIADDVLAALLLELYAALPQSGAMYVFADVKTGLRVFPSLPQRNVLVWDKQKIGMGYSWRRMHEWIAYVPRDEHELRSKARGDILRCAGEDDKLHPTEKPIGVLAPLIDNSTDVGQTVLDPFAGVGSTLVAAKRMGRKAIGIELKEEYCEITAQRLSQSALDIFGEPPADDEAQPVRLTW